MTDTATGQPELNRQWVLHDVRLFSGVNDEVIPDATVWVDGNVIRYAGPADAAPPIEADVPRVDGRRRFVMPGMTESHAHLSYSNAAPTVLNQSPIPVAMLDAIDNARTVLGSGFTSAISFGSAQGIDVPLRDMINQGRIPGPRLAASDRDIGSTGSNADTTGAGQDHIKLIADGPWAVRHAVRKLAKSRCDIVKIFLDGEAISPVAPPGILSFTDEEVAAAVQESHARGMRVACHSRSAAAVKQAVRHGVDLIGHANYLDDEAVDLLRTNRDRLFVGPGVAWEVAVLDRGHELGLSREAMIEKGYQREIDATVSSVKRMRAAGIRLLVGGDYGLSITPHGTNARDLEQFVDLFGMSATEALLCATRDGGAAADPNGMVGTLEAGKFADLVVVDGDPTVDVAVLQDHTRLHAVVKGGIIYSGLVGPSPFVRSPATGIN
jgi:imidazolonepropionase-like amidohydrolase